MMGYLVTILNVQCKKGANKVKGWGIKAFCKKQFNLNVLPCAFKYVLAEHKWNVFSFFRVVVLSDGFLIAISSLAHMGEAVSADVLGKPFKLDTLLRSRMNYRLHYTMGHSRGLYTKTLLVIQVWKCSPCTFSLLLYRSFSAMFLMVCCLSLRSSHTELSVEDGKWNVQVLAKICSDP